MLNEPQDVPLASQNQVPAINELPATFASMYLGYNLIEEDQQLRAGWRYKQIRVIDE